jgi:hypothetical protein
MSSPRRIEGPLPAIQPQPRKRYRITVDIEAPADVTQLQLIAMQNVMYQCYLAPAHGVSLILARACPLSDKGRPRVPDSVRRAIQTAYATKTLTMPEIAAAQGLSVGVVHKIIREVTQ